MEKEMEIHPVSKKRYQICPQDLEKMKALFGL